MLRVILKKKIPKSITEENSSCKSTYFQSHNLSKQDVQDMSATAWEIRKNS